MPVWDFALKVRGCEHVISIHVNSRQPWVGKYTAISDARRAMRQRDMPRRLSWQLRALYDSL
eukprot:13751093-Alexandrium_andersonii.AAC.1